MQPSLQSERLTGLPRARLLVATLVSLVLLAGCGRSSNTTTPASPGGASNSGATVAARSGAANPGSTAPGALAFARCMRSNGVPNFPDPQPGGGFLFSMAGINPSAPALRAARAKCQKLMPVGGPPGPGTTTHPSAQTLAKLLGIAQCMRQHGVPDFPDPRTTVPLNPFGSGDGVITDYDGAILLFPSTLDMQSPAYMRAAATCGALAEKLGRGPH